MASREMTLKLDPTDLRNAIDALLDGNATVRMTAQYGEWLTIKKASEILTVSRPTVYRMIEDGRIRAVDGRVVTESIADYLSEKKGRRTA